MEKEKSFQLTDEQGQILLALARQTLQEQFDQLPEPRPVLQEALQDEGLQQKRGTFICLKISGELRGCIGNLSGDVSIAEGVRHNALNAAFHDPRFAALSAGELEQTQIEVSVLTEPRSLNYQGPADLVAKLRPFTDGVIIRRGPASATFLPQVWEQLPNPEAFLSHLCQKAGLPADAWRHEPLEVLVYQVQSFQEAQ